MSASTALHQLARGNYEVWRRARYEPTGIYVDTVPLPGMPNATQSMGRASITGVGVMFECVADAMGWAPREEVQARIVQSLSALNGDVNIKRTSQGWYPSFFDAQTGIPSGPLGGCMMCTGLMMAGVNFARNYFDTVDPSSASTRRIAQLASSIFNSIQWRDVLCNSQNRVDIHGTGLPMLEFTDGTCAAQQFPAQDGFYGFNEEHYTFWFAYLSDPQSTELQTMWERWQGRRQHIKQEYLGHKLLSEWSGYIVHLPFYTTQSFNSDPVYNDLLRSHWLADWAYYNNTAFAGEGGRYGLGAGTTPGWCSEGAKYLADRINQGSSHCRIISPYVVAGYLPVAPDLIQNQLLELLADGETVYQVPDSPHFVLWRKSMLDESWEGGYGLTMVDFSSELFGLSTVWLGADFYRNYSGFAGYTEEVEQVIV